LLGDALVRIPGDSVGILGGVVVILLNGRGRLLAVGIGLRLLLRGVLRAGVEDLGGLAAGAIG